MCYIHSDHNHLDYIISIKCFNTISVTGIDNSNVHETGPESIIDLTLLHLIRNSLTCLLLGSVTIVLFRLSSIQVYSINREGEKVIGSQVYDEFAQYCDREVLLDFL